MDLKARYGLKQVINARGTFTPLGVSRSSDHIAKITGEALKHYYDMDELQLNAGEIIARHCGAEFATLTNCASAAITLCVAASVTGSDLQHILALPDTGKLNNKIVIAAGHCVNYGHPIEQDIRLAGCEPVLVGNASGCTIGDLEEALSQSETAAVIYVESRLTVGEHPGLKEFIAAAHSRNIPIIIDAAAQDMRMKELVASGGDLIIFSAQKYLKAPTAGIVVGKRQLVEAVQAQVKGIGRGMKIAKEAILGTIAAIEQRDQLDMDQWSKTKQHEANRFAENLENIQSVKSRLVKDPTSGEFWRIDMAVDADKAKITAAEIAMELQSGSPAIYCNSARQDSGILNFEILDLDKEERNIIIDRIRQIVT